MPTQYGNQPLRRRPLPPAPSNPLPGAPRVARPPDAQPEPAELEFRDPLPGKTRRRFQEREVILRLKETHPARWAVIAKLDRKSASMRAAWLRKRANEADLAGAGRFEIKAQLGEIFARYLPPPSPYLPSEARE